ncbi:hypothetical protein DFH11DRAFT_1724890 [Phellopilus nigrolimitatus]|nr:hypothetical protein DFH11DRAFT_1724890 [Phellopilus nigrolimitatus]
MNGPPFFNAAYLAPCKADRVARSVRRLCENQDVAPVDLENAPGKCSELEPVPFGDIANLPTEPAAETADAAPETGDSAKVRLQGDEDFGDVGMCLGERLFASTKGWRCWHVKVNQNQRRFSIVSAFAASGLSGLVLAHGHCAEQLKRSRVVAAA